VHARGLLVLAALAVSPAAHAEPGATVGGTVLGRLSISRGPFAGGAAWAALTAWDRLHVGARASLATGQNLTVGEVLGEVGVWIHPSQRMSALFAWRLGDGYMKIDNDAVGGVRLHTFTVEAVAELAFAVSPRIELRVAPLVVTGHYRHLFQVELGAELGVGVRL
jgi:hypothetical protein